MQDFDDLLSGKKDREANKGLAEMFKDYYAKVKALDTQEYYNSAKSSLNSMSSRLERKR